MKTIFYFIFFVILIFSYSCKKEEDDCKPPLWFYNKDWKVESYTMNEVESMDTIYKYYGNQVMQFTRTWTEGHYFYEQEFNNVNYLDDYAKYVPPCIELFKDGYIPLSMFVRSVNTIHFSPLGGVAVFHVKDCRKGRVELEATANGVVHNLTISSD